MKSGYQWTKLVSGALLTLGFAGVAQAASPEIVVLSNRADLISGGDALVEIKVPAYLNPTVGVKVDEEFGAEIARTARLRSVLMADSTDW